MTKRNFNTLWMIVAAATWLGCGSSGSGLSGSGSEEIVTGERSLVDASRPTMANGTYAGAPDRTLETRLWYREDAPRNTSACRRGRCGLVILAHGYGGFTGRFDRFARGIAEAGYIVAAPTFPLTNQSAPGGLQILDFSNQPADVSFVIDRLLASSEDPTDELYGRIDADWIALVGHSLGGATVIANARLDSVRDERVDAVVGIAPAIFVIEGLLHGPATAQGAPLLIVQGTADTAVTYASTLGYFAEIPAPRFLVGLRNANHVDPIESDPYPGTFIPESLDATLAFLESVRTARSAPLDEALERLEGSGHEVASEP